MEDRPLFTDINGSILILSSTINCSIDLCIQSDKPFVNVILFFVLLFISIPSVCINIFAIYRLHGNTKLSVFVFRTILHVSLFTTCICIPFFLLELHYNSDFPLSALTCKLWLIIDYASIVCLGLLVSWASIQRHILIFGPIHIKKLQSSFKFKLIPTLLAISFPLLWYSTLATQCTYNTGFNVSFECRPCFENEKSIFLIDTIISLLVPLFITIIVTTLLVIRIVRLRYQVSHIATKKWRRCKRLTRQMILFSMIYSIGLLPYVLTNLNSLYELWPFMNLPWCIQISDAFTYVPCCFSSFLSIYAFPEIWSRRKILHPYQTKKTNRKRHMTLPQTKTILSSQF